MFFRLIKGTFIRQWKKMLMIASTILLGTSIATAMINVMLDVGDKINEELKTYGANITVVSKNAAVLSALYELEDDTLTEKMYLKEETTGELLTIFWANNIRDFNPFIDGNVTLNGDSVKLVGGWFNHHLYYEKKGCNNITLDDAAKTIGMAKKTLDDYKNQIKKGKDQKFNFNKYYKCKINVLKNYNSTGKIKNE